MNNTEVNTKVDVNELLKGLDGKVQIENIDQYLQQSGVVVKIHVGRIRGNFELKPSTLGVNMDNEDIQTFFKDHVKNGAMSFIPLGFEKEFQRIENRIRMAKMRMSLGYDNSYMPIEVFKEFKEQVQKAREEYFQVRDKILEQWDDLKVRFMNQLNSALDEMNPTDKNQIVRGIMQKYPTKAEYKNSFYLKTSLRAFPVLKNLSLLDESLSEEVRQSAIEDNLEMIHEVLGICFNEVFQVANTIYKAYDRSSKLSNKTRGALSNAIKSVKRKNLLKHPSVEQLVKDLEQLYHTSDADEGGELVESILSRSFGEANILGLSTYLDLRDCDLSTTDLEILYESYAHVA